MTQYKLKTPKGIENTVVKGYKKIEKTFVNNFLEEDSDSDSGYNIKPGKIGQGFIKTYKKIENKFVDTFLEEVEIDE
ncbi:MAG: hypothetical protein ACK5LC_09465 [Coprobacillaceae bacterium]